jgi:hypothetical protein
MSNMYKGTNLQFFFYLMAKINVFSHCFQSLSRAHPPSKPVSTGRSLVGSTAPAGSLKDFRCLKRVYLLGLTYIFIIHRVLDGSGFQSWPCLRRSYIRLSLWFTCRKTLSQRMRIEHFHNFFSSFLAPFVTIYLISSVAKALTHTEQTIQ